LAAVAGFHPGLAEGDMSAEAIGELNKAADAADRELVDGRPPFESAAPPEPPATSGP
jgi:hypothetical protein